jgi:hypothetical protein
VDAIFKRPPFYLIALFVAGCFYNPPILNVVTDSPKSELTKKISTSKNELPKFDNKPRLDPFESNYKNVYHETPAYELALPRRLAPQQAEKIFTDKNKNILIPNIPRRVAGIMQSGSVSAILESIIDGKIYHNYVIPGEKVPSGSKDIPYLTVDAITNNYLILSSPYGSTIKVSLSGLSPDALNQLKNYFN